MVNSRSPVQLASCQQFAWGRFLAGSVQKCRPKSVQPFGGYQVEFRIVGGHYGRKRSHQSTREQGEQSRKRQ